MYSSKIYNKTSCLLVLVGPTAVGKTELAISLARWLDTEIVSTDSRQFYQEMNIGTAKPTENERKTVPHHLVNFLSIQTSYDVKSFEQDALEAIQNIFNRKTFALATGGSGLYVKVLCEGIDEMPQGSEDLKKNLAKRLEQEGLESLANELQAKDPVYYHSADIKNPRRVLRALEVIESSGKPYSSFRQQKKNQIRPFRTIKIGLQRERETLYKRIDQRVDQMLSAGLFEEAERLYPYRHLNALQTVGYQEIFSYLDGAYDRTEAIRLIKRNSRRFAKRQLTWFRKDEEIRWFDAGKERAQLEDEVKHYLQQVL